MVFECQIPNWFENIINLVHDKVIDMQTFEDIILHLISIGIITCQEKLQYV